MSAILIVTAVLVCLVAWIFYVFKQKPTESDVQHDVNGTSSKESRGAGKKAEKDTKSSKKGKKEVVKAEREPTQNEPDFAHPWLKATLKGHTQDVHSIHLSPNGHLLASAAPDRTVLLWTTKDFDDRNHKQIRVNVDLDSATQVQWSPDNKAFIIARADDSILQVFKLGKKPDGSVGNIQNALKFEKVHGDEIMGLGIACNGNYIMSCGRGGLMVIWDIKGNILAQKMVGDGEKQICMAKVSPCSRYVAAASENCGSTMMVYEVKFTASKGYDSMVDTFKLSGHKKGVYAFDFNTDTSKIATIDKELGWRLYDTTGNHVDIFRSGTLSTTKTEGGNPVISISSDCRLIIAGVGHNLEIYSIRTGLLLHKIDNVHKEPVKGIVFPANDDHFISCGDRIIKVFHNVIGLKEKKADLNEQIKDHSLSQGLRNRLISELKLLENE